jgi:hypothetical protein
MKKKLLLISLLCLFCSVCLLAGKPVTVKSGKASVLKTPAKALLEIDYSNTKIGKQPLEEYLKAKGDDYVRDWPSETATAASYFTSTFNKKNKGIKLTTDETSASYMILIRVKYLDMGNAGSFFVTMAVGGSNKAGGVIMSGTVDIIDLKTNEVACVLYVDEIKGESYPKEDIRMGMMYSELAKRISKLK